MRLKCWDCEHFERFDWKKKSNLGKCHLMHHEFESGIAMKFHGDNCEKFEVRRK